MPFISITELWPNLYQLFSPRVVQTAVILKHGLKDIHTFSYSSLPFLKKKKKNVKNVELNFIFLKFPDC